MMTTNYHWPDFYLISICSFSSFRAFSVIPSRARNLSLFIHSTLRSNLSIRDFSVQSKWVFWPGSHEERDGKCFVVAYSSFFYMQRKHT
jgi:hypothetical protein